ncbi:unnamed protein product [Darwinula stevensoni]|uniref:Hcy-binding domain-containing protein n=1 Tax=Darwinula stevensoni TaxID=69355 RepID=A0A7R9AAG5_9CRUS|nr:unnamed protein product [Darwinula stevensoni]CAG0898324.1 unnamed protein product [Darwinula stevensoni]
MVPGSKGRSEPCYLLDGGLATTLHDMGYPVDEDPLWSAAYLQKNPDAIKRVHLAFLDAGAQVISTASYQANIEGFKKHLNVSQDEARSLITSAVKLAHDAADTFCRDGCPKERPLIAGSLGPYGASLHDGSEYHGCYVDEVSKSQLMDFHAPHLDALLLESPDLIAWETIPALKEAIVLAELTAAHDKKPKTWISFSCRNSTETNHGEPFLECVKAMQDLLGDQLIGVGVNCTAPRHVTGLLESASHALNPNVAFVVYPNSGETWAAGVGWSGQKEILDEGHIKEWQDLGATYIGGCCRVSPDDIKQMKRILASRVQQ